MSNFRVGQKVVCVKPIKAGCIPWGEDPKVGDILTVREVAADPTTSNVGLRFEEIRTCIHPILGQEGLFHPERFRPVSERKTDISIFKAMLAPSKAKEAAE